MHKFLDKNHDQVRQDVLDLFVRSRTRVSKPPLASLDAPQALSHSWGREVPWPRCLRLAPAHPPRAVLHPPRGLHVPLCATGHLPLPNSMPEAKPGA